MATNFFPYSGRVSLTEFRAVFPVCNAIKMAWQYTFLSLALFDLSSPPFSPRHLSSSSSSSLSLVLYRRLFVVLSLAPRVFRVRLYRAVNGEQKALGAHAPALSFSIYRLSSLVLFSFFLSFCPTRHADHRGPLSPTPRNLQPPSVFRSSGSPIRAADRPAFSTTVKGEAADDQRDRRNQTIKSLSSTELNRDVPE